MVQDFVTMLHMLCSNMGIGYGHVHVQDLTWIPLPQVLHHEVCVMFGLLQGAWSLVELHVQCMGLCTPIQGGTCKNEVLSNLRRLACCKFADASA